MTARREHARAVFAAAAEMLPDYPPGSHEALLADGVRAEIAVRAEKVDGDLRRTGRQAFTIGDRWFSPGTGMHPGDRPPTGEDPMLWPERRRQFLRLNVRAIVGPIINGIRARAAEAERSEQLAKQREEKALRAFVHSFKSDPPDRRIVRERAKAEKQKRQRVDGRAALQLLAAAVPSPPRRLRSPTPPRPLVASAYRGGVGRVRVEMFADGRPPVVTDRRGHRVVGVTIDERGMPVRKAMPEPVTAAAAAVEAPSGPTDHDGLFALAAAVGRLAAKEQPIVVNVAQPDAPVVHVHMPEQAAPIVNVSPPPARAIRVENLEDGSRRYVPEELP